MRLFVTVGTLALLVVAGSTFAQDEAKDLEKMQGVWKVESARSAGEFLPAEKLAKLKFTFRGNQLVPSDNPKDFLTIKLDPAKDPAAISMTSTTSKVSQGIYKFQDGALNLCFTDEGDRPKDFSSTPQNKAVWLVLKRDKK